MAQILSLRTEDSKQTPRNHTIGAERDGNTSQAKKQEGEQPNQRYEIVGKTCDERSGREQSITIPLDRGEKSTWNLWTFLKFSSDLGKPIFTAVRFI